MQQNLSPSFFKKKGDYSDEMYGKSLDDNQSIVQDERDEFSLISDLLSIQTREQALLELSKRREMVCAPHRN